VNIPWLAPDARPESLPPAADALDEPNGLLAIGGNLGPEWLLYAYRHGIFPWYSRGQPILWWSPDPRCVLAPDEFRVHRSLARSLRHGQHRLAMDTAFAEVVAGCAAPRPGQDGTWITGAMARAYTELHRLGHAHCVEVWHQEQLVGGLYGVRIGAMFFGESMFSRIRDASKFALKALTDWAIAQQIALIDCQMATQHLKSLGARAMPRASYLARVAQLTAVATARA
jgi:leucyl/phenylalanyl-tRNA---protein transferase